MSKLLVASLITLATAAAAAPDTVKAPTPPPAPKTTPTTCSKTSPELASIVDRRLEPVDENAKPIVYKIDASFTLRDSGAWSYTEIDAKTDKPKRQLEGCLDAPRLDKLVAAHKAAAWQVTPVGIRCHAVGFTFSEYSVGGKLVWKSETCGATKLDDPSMRAFMLFNDIRRDLTKPSALETSKGKP